MYSRLLKSREEFKPVVLTVFFKISHEEFLVSRDKSPVSQDKVLIS